MTLSSVPDRFFAAGSRRITLWAPSNANKHIWKNPYMHSYSKDVHAPEGEIAPTG
jgi:hypothetical protein